MTRILLAVAGCLFLVSSSGAVIQQQAPDSGIRWLTDKNKAFAESRKTGKPLWVLFR